MTGVWICLVQVTREAPTDSNWPAAAFVSVVGPAADKLSFLRAVKTYGDVHDALSGRSREEQQAVASRLVAAASETNTLARCCR